MGSTSTTSRDGATPSAIGATRHARRRADGKTQEAACARAEGVGEARGRGGGGQAMPRKKAIEAAGGGEPAGVPGDGGAPAGAGEALAPVERYQPKMLHASSERRPDALAEAAVIAGEMAAE